MLGAGNRFSLLSAEQVRALPLQAEEFRNQQMQLRGVEPEVGSGVRGGKGGSRGCSDVGHFRRLSETPGYAEREAQWLEREASRQAYLAAKGKGRGKGKGMGVAKPPALGPL